MEVGTELVCKKYCAMVCFSGGEPTERTGRFLQPTASSPAGASGVPHSPLLSELISSELCAWPPKIFFNGWRHPCTNWVQWVRRLLPRYGRTWQEAGVYDAIAASTCEIRRNLASILGLAELWCEETTTFVFPWGEATVTLEDIVVLGGLSVLGQPCWSPLTEELQAVVEKMREERKELSKRLRLPALHSDWINHFMGSGGALEHVAFLSLWLSGFVLPSPHHLPVPDHSFSLAARFAKGIRLALAPAVLVGQNSSHAHI